jgi:sugar-specific transcriptional regulator TrmB
MFEHHLQQTGLTRDQAAMYEVLVRQGALPASKAAREANVGRTLAYVVLEQLENMGLVEKKVDKKVFIATHPLKLQEHAEHQKVQADKALSAIEAALPELSSAFRLASGKPGIEFFEGESGITQVLNDTLDSKGEIFTYADIESIEQHVHDINQAYMGRRIKKEVPKKILVPDTAEMRKNLAGYQKPFTEIRLVAAKGFAPFHSAMEIYDNKIAYITFEHGNLTASVIHDKAIYTMHRFLFQALWEQALQV